MNSLPKNWITSTLGEIASYIQRGKSPKYCELSELPVINQKCVRWYGIDTEFVKYIHPDQWSSIGDERYLKRGDILWNSTGTGTIGRASLFRGEIAKVVVDSHVTIVRLNNSLFSSEYVFYFIMSPFIQKIIEDMQTGSTNQVELGKRVISERELPLPPLNEQKRIVAKIEELFSELDKGIESLKKAKEQLKLYRQSVLKQAFEGKLTEKWREISNVSKAQVDLFSTIMDKRKELIKKTGTKLKDFHENDDSFINLPVVPTQWRWCFFGNLFSEPLQNGLYKPASEYGTGTDIIRIDDFYDGKLVTFSDFKKVNLKRKEVDKYSVRNGHIVINRVNSIEYLGKCAYIEKLSRETVFESNIMKCQVMESYILPKFITFFLSTQLGKKEITMNAKHAVNQASINQTDVSLTRVPLPPTDEQQKIIELIETQFSVIDQLESGINTNLKKAEILRQSILKKAFSGQLVPQDPNDEPASVLLEKIKAEKAKQISTKKQKKEVKV